MEQLMDQTGTKYVKGKACHYCNSKHVVVMIDYDHVFQRCEDCGCLADPKCDSCGTSLKLTKDSYICCEPCGGFAAMTRRSSIRGSIGYHQQNVEKTEQKLKEAKKSLKEAKKSLKENKKYLKGWLIRAKKGELVGIEKHELELIEKD